MDLYVMGKLCKTILFKSEGRPGNVVQLVKYTNRKGLSLITQNPCEKPAIVACTYSLSTVEVERERSLGFMANQLNAINEFQANERPCLHIQDKWHIKKNIQKFPLASTHIHTHVLTYLHT